MGSGRYQSTERFKLESNMELKKCQRCLNGRVITSENGYHSICCLSQKKAIVCMFGKKNHFVTLEKDKDGKINLKRSYIGSDYGKEKIL